MTGTPDSRPVVILADDDEAITSNLAAFLNRGHRYSGDIGAVSGINVPGISGLTGNDVGIQLTRQ
jgi:hypothetical protein